MFLVEKEKLASGSTSIASDMAAPKLGAKLLRHMYGLTPKAGATAEFVTRGANEILFLVGCSLVLFSIRALKKMTIQDQS